MIAAPRGECPRSLRREGSAGAKERERAVDFYAARANVNRSFTFRAYKRDDVLAALILSFHHKCAYCESDMGAMAPTDIEHYRPKGAVDVDGKLVKPGYYWLGAEWENLLPSCIDCNRERGHEYPIGKRKTGKANKFPLGDERRRARVPGAEAREDALLLDPTRDTPREHLEFFDKGMVRPAQNGGAPSERGKETIAVVGLDRPELVRSRADRLVLIESDIEGLREAAEELIANPDSAFANNTFDRELKRLGRHISKRSPYAGMARQHILPVLEELGGS